MIETMAPIYHEEIPPFLRDFLSTPPMERLQEVGMNCGCEYTVFPRFAKIPPYTRFDHSLGVALIVWHYTGDRAQTLAGLFHDIAAPVFTHTVDFLDGDHLRQESTEANTEAMIASSPEIMALLKKQGLDVEQVSEDHRYPIANNDSPALSADRLEYTLGNALGYGFAGLAELRAFYRDLTVGTDEQGREELSFRTPEVAADFAAVALKNSRVYVADEDRFAMETLAGVLRLALKRGVLCRADLWRTEGEVIGKLERDTVCGVAWSRFCALDALRRSKSCPGEDGWLCIDAKKRWIDPLVLGKGRVSAWNGSLRREMEAFRALDFDIWLSRAE